MDYDERDEPVELIVDTIKLIKDNAEADGFGVTKPVVLEVHDRNNGSVFATVNLETKLIEFRYIPKGIESLADVKWVADLTKLDFRSNIMILERLPESFQTCKDVVAKVIAHVVQRYGGTKGLSEDITVLTKRYIAKILLVDHQLDGVYMILDLRTATRWLMTSAEWAELRGID